MDIKIRENPQELGKEAARLTAQAIHEAIASRGVARIVLSTGESQFETIEALVAMDIDWTKVEMFHLDEYVGLSDQHPASFRKYLRDRFTSKIQLKNAFFVDGEGDYKAKTAKLTEELRRAPIDVALVGIGVNAHIAFNDPPADFNTTEAYIVVNLNEACKAQQVGEGWFPTANDVPVQAISMTVHEIMNCKKIISSVPHKVKAPAVRQTLESELTPEIPSTMLKKHPDWTLVLERESAGLIVK